MKMTSMAVIAALFSSSRGVKLNQKFVDPNIEGALDNDAEVLSMVDSETHRNEEKLQLYRRGVDPVRAEEILSQKEEQIQKRAGPAPGVDSGPDTNDKEDPYSKGPYTSQVQKSQAPGCDVSVDSRPGSELRGPLATTSSKLAQQAPGCDVSVDSRPGAELRGPLATTSSKLFQQAPGCDVSVDTRPGAELRGPLATTSSKLAQEAPGCDVSVDSRPGAELRGPLATTSSKLAQQAPGCDVSVDSRPGAELRGPLATTSSKLAQEAPGCDVSVDSRPGAELRGPLATTSSKLFQQAPGCDVSVDSRPGAELRGPLATTSSKLFQQAPGCDVSVDSRPGAELRGPLAATSSKLAQAGPYPGVDTGADTNDKEDPYSNGPYTSQRKHTHALAQQASFVENYQKDDLQGWSSTRGISNLDHGDEFDEMGQRPGMENPADPTYKDLTNMRSYDALPPKMEKLTNSWMMDPDTDAVKGRLAALDKEAWAGSAKQASRSTIREFLTDVIDDEVDSFTKEKADDASFHNDHIIKVTDDDYRPGMAAGEWSIAPTKKD